MTKAEELWRKYQHDGWIGPTAFAAALKEYGEAAPTVPDTPTPRTDAFYESLYHESVPQTLRDVVDAKEKEFARQLERELTAANERGDKP